MYLLLCTLRVMMVLMEKMVTLAVPDFLATQDPQAPLAHLGTLDLRYCNSIVGGGRGREGWGRRREGCVLLCAHTKLSYES